MSVSIRICSAFVSWLLCSTLLAQGLPSVPACAGERARYYAMIETPRGYVSGVCLMQHDGEQLTCAIVNEFGVSALHFTYSERRDRVKIASVVPMLDHWYIKRMLRRDLRQWIHSMRQGEYTYHNTKRKITYSLSALNEDETEQEDNDNRQTP
ncbi:MAG: hypothetical protein II562_03255 [Prevotella sp.]|nr:hypothetical protein [Prevotella sp.]